MAQQLSLAVHRARKDGEPALATLSLDVDARLDPTAAVCASRRPGESWFVLEQPERERVAIAGLGEAVRVTAVRVRWPDGTEERFPGGEVDHAVVLRQGQGQTVTEAKEPGP